MKNFNQKSLEDVIKDLNKKYKNVPSPLNKNNTTINSPVVPQQKLGGDIRDSLLGDFKPTTRSWS